VEACLWTRLPFASAFTLVSVYGHAQQPDIPWMHQVLAQADSSTKAVFAIGDWNWKPAHEAALPDGWRVSAPVVTTVAETAITRGVSNTPCQALRMQLLLAFLTTAQWSSRARLSALRLLLSPGFVNVLFTPGMAAQPLMLTVIWLLALTSCTRPCRLLPPFPKDGMPGTTEPKVSSALLAVKTGLRFKCLLRGLRAP